MTGFADLVARARAQVDEASPDACEELLADGAVLIDVREGDEVALGAPTTAMHLPRGQLESLIEGRVERDETVVVMCASGARSVLAARSLGELGYSRVVSMAGGFDAYKRAGLPWVVPTVLSEEQRRLYHRHLLLPEVGIEGQKRLLGASVLCLGAGGLGSPAALYLAAAGVGTLGIVDMDVVDASNLQRQILHTRARVGTPKVDSAAETINALNPDIAVRRHHTRLDASNVEAIFVDYDLIIDGTDNFPVRYLVNDASVKLGLPVVHGSIYRFEGQVSVFDPRRGPTYRDMVPVPPPPELAPNCAEAGVLGVLAGTIGSLQALEAIKWLLDIGQPLIGRLLVFDAKELRFDEFKIPVNPDNPVTWDNRDAIEIRDLDQYCAPAMRPDQAAV